MPFNLILGTRCKSALAPKKYILDLYFIYNLLDMHVNLNGKIMSWAGPGNFILNWWDCTVCVRVSFLYCKRNKEYKDRVEDK